MWITSTVVISYIIKSFCTNVLKYNTELRIFIAGLVVVYLLFGRILVNFSQNQNGEWCYPALQHFGWSETSLWQVWYVISTHSVGLLGIYILLLRLRYFNFIFSILIIVVAWAVIPREIGITTGPFLYNSWRIFVFLCGTPAFLVAISLFGFPESPQFLALHGKPEFALKVISKIYAANKGLHYTSFPVIINTK